LWKGAEIFVYPAYILNFSTLPEALLRTEYINNKGKSEVLCDNSLIETRFNTTVSVIRQTGIQLLVIPPSYVQAFYRVQSVQCVITVFVCVCVCVYVVVDTHVHRYDLMQL
jgi:hypothetical protein